MLIVGGTATVDHSMLHTDLERGDVTQDGGVRFSSIGDLDQGRELPSVIPTSGGVYVLGGRAVDGGVADDELLTLAVNGTATAHPLPGSMLNTPRFAAAVVRVGDDVLVMGGIGFDSANTVLSDVESARLLPDGGLGSFTSIGEMHDSGGPLPRAGFSAFVRTQGVLDQVVLVGGGGRYGFALTDNGKGVMGMTVAAGPVIQPLVELGSLSNPHVDGEAVWDAASSKLYAMGGAPSIASAENPGFFGQPNAAVDVLSALDNGHFGDEASYPTLLSVRRLGFATARICRDVYLIGGETWNGNTNAYDAMATQIDVLHLP